MIIKTDEEIKILSDAFEKDALSFADKLDNSNLLAEDYNSINITLANLLTGSLIGTWSFARIPDFLSSLLESSNLLRELASKKTKQEIVDFFKENF